MSNSCNLILFQIAAPFTATGFSRGTALKCALNTRRKKVKCGRMTPRAVGEVYEAVPPSTGIVVGAVALAVPFFVAAVLFGERIYRQRSCKKCEGTGLVPNRAGFLKRCQAYVLSELNNEDQLSYLILTLTIDYFGERYKDVVDFCLGKVGKNSSRHSSSMGLTNYSRCSQMGQGYQQIK